MISILDHAAQMLVAPMVKPSSCNNDDSRLEVNETFDNWLSFFWYMAVLKNT